MYRTISSRSSHASVVKRGCAIYEAKQASAAIDAILDELSKDPDCVAVQSHIQVLKKNVANWKLKFLTEVANRSQEIFRAVLYPDNPLWDTCEGYWGGAGVSVIRLLGRLRNGCSIRATSGFKRL